VDGGSKALGTPDSHEMFLINNKTYLFSIIVYYINRFSLIYSLQYSVIFIKTDTAISMDKPSLVQSFNPNGSTPSKTILLKLMCNLFVKLDLKLG